MAKRTIFKSLGCLGPAGALISVVESFCIAKYPAAYELGQRAQLETDLDIKLRENRRLFIDKLFDKKLRYNTLAKPKNTVGKVADRMKAFWKELFELYNRSIEDHLQMLHEKYDRNINFYSIRGDQEMIRQTEMLKVEKDAEIKKEFENLTITVIGFKLEEFEEKKLEHSHRSLF